MSPDDPTVVFIGDAASAGLEVVQLDLACRFYGLRLVSVPAPRKGDRIAPVPNPNTPAPILAVLHGSDLARASAAQLLALRMSAEGYGVPVAVMGITPECNREALAPFAGGARVSATAAGPACGLWISAIDPASAGFELRGLRFALGPEPASRFECPPDPAVQVLATVGPTQSESLPALLRICRDGIIRYLLTRTATTDAVSGMLWQFRQSSFGEIAPLFLLLRDAGGTRCWHPPAALANLTIDDPWLKEPYGCLTFAGLLGQMRRERFHATIGFVPWNYDRSTSDVVALLRAHPEYFSIAVHGNNHDRYEFYRYEARPGDIQRPKPLEEQAFNIRQAVARMEAFHRQTGLDYDRVMVFPHAVCPAATFGLLKQRGFWATSNYNNVPLGESPPADPAVALRSANTEWDGFPALRRAYPEKYPEEAIAIDLFLGNPVLFMAHQDLFFDGIDAFNSYAHRVNARQPAVRWASLGEISRQLYLLRWTGEDRREVRLFSRHAKIDNPQSVPVEFRFAKREPTREAVERITVDGIGTTWRFLAGEVHFAATLSPGATSLIEVHYHPPADAEPVDVRRRGFRNRSLRLVADFRDLILSRSVVGRFLTRKYYRPGKRRPTLSGLVSRLTSFPENNQPRIPRSDLK